MKRIYYVAPSPEVAQALMDGTSTLLVVEARRVACDWPGDHSGNGHMCVVDAQTGAAFFEQAPVDYVRATKPCERCWGHRGADLTPAVTCPACDGEGQERIGIYVTCPTCGGEPCDRCNGSGKQIEQHDYASEVVACGWCYGEPCPDCTDGLVLVGSVLAVEVLPIRRVLDPLPGTGAGELTLAYGRQLWNGARNITHELAYHDPASLPGKYGVTVADARRDAS